MSESYEVSREIDNKSSQTVYTTGVPSLSHVTSMRERAAIKLSQFATKNLLSPAPWTHPVPPPLHLLHLRQGMHAYRSGTAPYSRVTRLHVAYINAKYPRALFVKYRLLQPTSFILARRLKYNRKKVLFMSLYSYKDCTKKIFHPAICFA